MSLALNIRSSEGQHRAETPARVSALSLASGEERPIRSPALELQEALEEMLNAPVAHAPRPMNAMGLGLGLLTVAGACAAFWISLGRVLISLA